MIEKARTVQKEWADAHDQAALARLAKEDAEAETRATAAATNNGVVKTEPGTDTTNTSMRTSASATSNSNSALSRESAIASAIGKAGNIAGSVGKRTAELPPNPHRGQLLPAHLREALRRYKRDGEGGGVGFSGLSLGNLGVRGSVTWSAGGVGGRRMFR
ncbi:hypothetical protein BJY01DRAFT_214403 [Aspergillus pseudoustus]|uniref:Uncharacterized protein n=1 Tax=Aspergillus pseudoustus TaxID=1810923 RepID=A0ABR4JYR5_9EURO